MSWPLQDTSKRASPDSWANFVIGKNKNQSLVVGTLNEAKNVLSGLPGAWHLSTPLCTTVVGTGTPSKISW